MQINNWISSVNDKKTNINIFNMSSYKRYNCVEEQSSEKNILKSTLYKEH